MPIKILINLEDLNKTFTRKDSLSAIRIEVSAVKLIENPERLFNLHHIPAENPFTDPFSFHYLKDDCRDHDDDVVDYVHSAGISELSTLIILGDPSFNHIRRH